MYASLLISLLAAFVAMLGKQWLNRYLRNTGGSTIERCGDRQRKCDGLKKWPFHFFVESLPVMLQAALLLLACGLCKHMASINTPVAGVLITLTVLGVLFYLGIVVVGTTSYECPFQTPLSVALRSVWKATKPHVTTTFYPILVFSVSLLWSPVLAALHHPWEAIQCQIVRIRSTVLTQPGTPVSFRGMLLFVYIRFPETPDSDVFHFRKTPDSSGLLLTGSFGFHVIPICLIFATLVLCNMFFFHL